MSDVLGRTVTGEITRNTHSQKEQKPGEELLPLLDAVLSQPGVESVRWTQYTPYFNDGDPCIFRVNEPSVKIEGNDEDGDYEDGYIDTYSMYDWKAGYKERVVRPGFESLYPTFNKLTEEMDYFENFLQESFGDHAMVTATTDGFNVKFYEHD